LGISAAGVTVRLEPKATQRSAFWAWSKLASRVSVRERQCCVCVCVCVLCVYVLCVCECVCECVYIHKWGKFMKEDCIMAEWELS